jgi:hypothetical protein
MEGATIHFFNSLINDEEGLTWEQLKQALLDRYGGHGEGDIYEQLTELRQTGNVDDYITDFEYLTAQIPRLPDKQFQGYFLHGLKGEIRGRLRSLAVMGDLGRAKLLQVTRAIEKEVEGRNGPGRQRNPQTGYGSNRNVGFGPNRSGGSDWVLVKGGKKGGPSGGNKSNDRGVQGERPTHGDRRGGTPRDRGYTQLSYNELMDRKQKNLCFKCKGPYSRTHQCPEKHLKVLVTDDEEGSEDEGKILAVEVSEEEEGVDGEMNVLSLLQLGQMSHKGGNKPQSIQLKGVIQEVPIVILVDSGATHNFIDKRLVQKMGWPADNTKSMCIRLGDGSRVQSGGVCNNLSIDIEGVQVEIEAQLFDLGGMDLILGVEWLRTLGDIIMNWNTHSMSFWYNKRWVTFHGLSGEVETLNKILRPTRKRGAGWLQPMVPHDLKQQEELAELLNTFEKVFKEPTGLPPRRSKEHIINLRAGCDAVNVRPYRYLHHHKNEIEKQVKELLATGVIRHSISSFSSPVILVKKKDGTWRMCIDYRALNKVTIPDKFPIPVIEELLDELNGASIFSKLDLKSGYHQVRVREEDVHKTAFRTHEGHYEFLVMPFGLMNAPSTFQSLMNEVFRSMLRKFVLVFFDDILVYSKDWNSHMKHLKEVLWMLDEHGLVANKKKCHFAQSSIEYLGHVISHKGVAVDPSKVDSVTNWPTPRNVKGVRGFLGLTSY